MYIDQMKITENMKFLIIHMITPDFIYVNNLEKLVYFLYIMFATASNQGFFPQFCQVT
jgi:hypothetical protein